MSRKILLVICFNIALFVQSCSLSDCTKNLGNNYVYRNEGGDIKEIYCKKVNGGFIPSTIIDFKYDKKFIIAKQKPKVPQDPLYDVDIRYKNGADKIYYWIIIKQESLVLGPLEFDEFKKKADEYSLPSEMIIN